MIPPKTTHTPIRTTALKMTVAAVAAIILIAPSVVSAKTFYVGVSVDLPDLSPGNGSCLALWGSFGVCTLRAAVEEANAWPGQDTIVLYADTFTLENTGGQLIITDNVIIQGVSAWETVIETDGNHRMFEVETGVSASITDMAMRGSTLSGNWAGAIKGASGSLLTISRVWFDQNSATGGCGAVGTRGDLFIYDSTFSHNSAGGHEGGGALCVSHGGSAQVENTTFFENSSSQGGAIYVTGPTSALTVTSSTLIDNIDPTPATDPSHSIYLGSGSLHIDKSLIRPSNCYLWDILAVSSNGGNAVGPGNGCIIQEAGDQWGLTAQQFSLGSLGDYGGPVPTILLGSQSLAVDPPLSFASCPTYDARGEPRVGRCDVGAIERQLDDPAVGPIFFDGFETGSTSAWN